MFERRRQGKTERKVGNKNKEPSNTIFGPAYERYVRGENDVIIRDIMETIEALRSQ